MCQWGFHCFYMNMLQETHQIPVQVNLYVTLYMYILVLESLHLIATRNL